jgi:hypothetical protein
MLVDATKDHGLIGVVHHSMELLGSVNAVVAIKGSLLLLHRAKRQNVQKLVWS